MGVNKYETQRYPTVLLYVFTEYRRQVCSFYHLEFSDTIIYGRHLREARVTLTVSK